MTMVDRIGGDINPLAGSSGSVVDENGETLLSTDTTGGGAYILGPTMLRSIIGGVANGDWAKPPLDPSAVISDDNGLPYWDWVPAASGNVTLQVVADGTSASGNVLRFTAVGAGTADTSYVERYISVLGSRARTLTYQPRSVWSAATNNANFRVFTEAVFVENDGTTLTGGTATNTATGAAVAASSLAYEVQVNPNTNGAVPSDGAFIRLRVGVSFAATVSGTATADCCEVRIDTGLPQLLITDNAAPQTYGYAVAYLNNGAMWVRANEAGTAGANPTMFLNGQSGDIALRAHYGVGTAVPSSGHIYLQPKDTTGRVYVTNGTSSGTAGFYAYEANGLRMAASDSRLVIGERTAASVSEVDDPGVVIDGSSDGQGGGFIWVERDTDANTDAALFLSSNYLNSAWQAVRFLRKITAGGTSLSSTGYISVANSTTTAPSFASGSDYRLKDDIRDATEDIDFAKVLKALRPVKYTERDTSLDLLGFIAHEVQAVVPEAVEGTKDAVNEDGTPAYQYLKQAAFIPYLVGALKDALARIDALEDEFKSLKK